MRIVAISDTHSLHWRISEPIPEGDVLVHSGDCTKYGSLDELEDFNLFLRTLPHPHKIVVAGNHDFCFQETPVEARELLSEALYLEDSLHSIEGVNFYGSPWQPRFHDWAFNLPRGEALAKKWRSIPSGVDVLITHTPPAGILDEVVGGGRVGYEELMERVVQLQVQLHLFGHIHEAYGKVVSAGTTYVNASICNSRYQPVHAPVVIDL